MPTMTWPQDADTVQLVALARQWVDDLNLTAVRQWKAEQPGRLAIGHLPIYAPRPILEAVGVLPVAVFGGGDQVDIIRGDSYFQSYICHIPRSTIELALGGQYDCLDGMMFPSICDVIRNLSGMWRMLFPERWSCYVDLPQNFDAKVGGKFYVSELRRMARELHERGALELTDQRLRQAIADENRRRAVLQRLDDLRHKEPWKVPASEVYLISRVGGMMFAKDHADFAEAYLAAVQKRPARARDNVRVVMVGSFCEQPPLDLLKTLEKAGCDIVDDDLQLGMRMIDGPIPEDTDDPLAALANAFLFQGVACASRYIANDVKGRQLIEKVRSSGAEGVVFSAASFCDPALLDQPMLETALTNAGIPYTSLKFAENTGQFQVIREQAGAFSDAVKLWGEPTGTGVTTATSC